ncbi:microfilariae surface-associated protein, putative [Brugia malayi]|uniref:Bm7382, isoform b n=1 Tax=Brugia malayi TaxID=6279 RepID=A0A1I9G0R5_BRUMA|nr:microfilariae surface-associated protein, putative [Brugia malayi]CDP92826.1 Bm7382, isoform b [Brugia malayi]VIO87599.1 microfilariae surface-associated protein, putative [Brugia malayi]
MLKYSILLVFVTVGVYCDLLSEAGDFFSKHFTDFKSLFAKDEKQLQQSVEQVKNLLATVQDKIAQLKSLANEAQKGTLNKVGYLISEINDFQKNVFDSKMEFNQKENNWENLVKKIFIDEGLNKILPLLQKLQNSASATFATYLLTCIIPLLTNALRE